ncbi:aminopeptidase P family protein [Marinitenerispora sediminis]|uniref:Xaa-Pro aminopeptidase n=1 Tax=Marinitenerispora sediminis TaxID=1931232 RepID=A0A368T747_9ACTN|nr:aminopeptidase P family protein [Marinitenerispora sediminis]RCV50912.1 Xaa-Pro aminopeptidase [Marinitenerispora sediminis]RCV59728.1 Xaa-Pro aminopeptidase [Marinitenerispora sediminis]RCV59820.1 Xaa-Pro aminopeptidase [Marinitenerispora sediminis]
MTDDQRPQSETGRDDADAPEFRPRKNGPYQTVSDELAAWMRTGWADTERRDLHPVEQAPYAAKRRAALGARFPGERLVIPAGRLKVRSNDTEYRFRAASDYVYLTGDQSEDGCLVLEPRADGGHEAALYLRPRSNRENGEFWLAGDGELWVGRRNSLTEAARLYALPTRDVRALPDDLRAAQPPTRIVRGHDSALEAVLAELRGTAAEDAAAERDEELAVYLHDARLVKDDWEVAQLQGAVDSTVRGFEDVVRVLPQAEATSERYIEGAFFLRARVEGNDVGYGTIAAAGSNATTLHWVRNDGPVRAGDLVLLDAGVEATSLYTADVTRTLPVSGRFDDVQRRVYDLVYAAQEAGIAEVAPGRPFRAYHDAAQRVLAEGLVEWGLLEGPVDRVLELGLQRRYTLHGTGHMLGLDVHDCAQARTESYVDGVLAPGMVLTVEPGLYFQPDDLTVPEELRGIGVRIEDDVLVTSEGNRVLSAALPRRSDEVEAWLAGLLPGH